MSTPYIKQKIDCLINVSKIVTIHYFEFDKNFRADGESHDFWEIVYIDKGEAEIIAKNKKMILKQGEAVFHKPNEYHSINANGTIPPNVFIITFVCKSKAMNYFKNKHMSIPAPLRMYISNIISEGEATYYLVHNNPYLTELVTREDAPVGGKQLIKVNLEQLLIMLIRFGMNAKPLSAKKEIDDYLVQKILVFLHDNIYGRICVEKICQKFNFSRTYICARFKKSCGCSITEYFTKIKIEEAKTLIREQKYSISEISDMLQYDNPHYFSGVFKKIVKMSPKEYRNSVLFYD